jgi:hypothetical protein
MQEIEKLVHDFDKPFHWIIKLMKGICKHVPEINQLVHEICAMEKKKCFPCKNRKHILAKNNL